MAMVTKRSYEDACATSHALDLIGERWALLVVRELILGPKRFTDLRAGLPGISPNVLTQRLTELEAGGVVRRRKLPPPASTWAYELTEWGADLEPVIVQLGRWGVRSPNLFRDVPIGIDSLILSFRTMFSPEAAKGLSLSLELRFGEDHFCAAVADGKLAIARGSATRPAVVVSAADPNAVAAVVYGGQDLKAMVGAGAIRLEGDRAVFERFTTLFPLPAPAQPDDRSFR